MKTEQLVHLLATGAGAVEHKAWARRYITAMALGLLAAVVLMLVTLGLRTDLASAVWQPMFWIKFAFAGSLAGASLVTAMRLSRPGMRLGLAPGTAAVPVLVMWLAAAVTLIAADPGQSAALLLGKTWSVCPILIAMLSVPIFVAVMWAMRGLAPTNLRLAGTASGLLAGSAGAVVYCLHCPEMEPPFIAVWYVLGMLIPTAVGAILGPKLLRW